jgi:NAD(P)H dehydrogenase (quinone)
MNFKKILIINGHPDQESFNFGLAEAYKKGAFFPWLVHYGAA